MYAFSFVLANFGIAIAARMPMITTTINSSISVNPLRFIFTSPLARRPPRFGRAYNQTSGWGGRLEYISRLEMGPLRWVGGCERAPSFGGIADRPPHLPPSALYNAEYAVAASV